MNHEFSIDGLFDFLNAGVSAFHSTAAAAAILIRGTPFSSSGRSISRTSRAVKAA